MAGTVVDRAANEGETLNAVQTAPTVLTIADLSVMTVEAEVSEADVPRLKPGMTAYFTLIGAGSERYEGTLRQIRPTPQTENGVVLYYALFDIPNPDGTLMIGMSAQVFFVEAAAKDVLLVPVAALSDLARRGDMTTARVRVAATDGTTQTREVTVGVRSRVAAEVRSGLAEGERVVVVSQSSDTPRAATRGFGPPPMF
ncbi:HlyD family efflux transporter periplasmic adaptor subunit [Methylobrevis pamukkalensis]|uniref:Macrolide export protein MacA n=1 Tax=Methylobrevis pamukkalensis TaxID=1439726 RepID=A0A1E3GP36_9HYPH|nr:HlyD family efflux transporter periplasmic adaptor subunit [Methylobrevis pamukkalensis]ODN65809.1 Macrolide export protein MacA [Methylobrevis pamukkalensis]